MHDCADVQGGTPVSLDPQEQARVLAIADVLRSLIMKAESATLPAVALTLRLALADILMDADAAT